MDINKIIFESMLKEALKKVNKHTGSLQEAVDAVAVELELTNEEHAALAERAKKVSKLVHEAPAEEIAVEEPAPEAEPMAAPMVSGNAMHFGSEDDLDTAAGMLMYKNCPWKTKSKDNGQLLIEFDDRDTLEEAMGILKRKFEFVEQGMRRVGVVEFDNLADYGKVMEFMKKQGMMIETADMGPLDEDIDLQEKTLQEIEGAAIPPRAFAARLKSGDVSELNVVEDQSARAVVVRKRWK